jgi:hypothetical protein
MDILTPKGEETRKQEVRAIDILLRNMKGYHYVDTPKEKPAIIDGFITKGGFIAYACEVKCRTMTKQTLETDYQNRWLVTLDKIIAAREVAGALCVPLVGLLYLVPDDLLLVQRICEEPDNQLGLFATSMILETTVTQRTVNGGTAKRTNAYIDMTNAKVFQ